jgi:predicted alpha/beta-hydrolase family hydrolase
VVEPSARFEEIKIPLADPVHGLEEVSAVLGIPRWWPTGARVAVVFAHGASGDMSEPALEALHRELTERRYLSLRFNFPFAEAGKRRPDEMSVLRRTLRNAIALLARDPTAAPAHLFLVGKGLGAQVAADLSIARVRADGLILMGYPLHPGSKPDELQAEQLYRVVAPLLFVQGTRDRCCDVDALKRVLTRVGAPTRLQVVENADQNFRVLKKSGRTEEQVNQEILSASDSFIEQVLDGV